MFAVLILCVFIMSNHTHILKTNDFLFNTKSIKNIDISNSFLCHPYTFWHDSRNSSIVTTPSLLQSIFWVQTDKQSINEKSET